MKLAEVRAAIERTILFGTPGGTPDDDLSPYLLRQLATRLHLVIEAIDQVAGWRDQGAER